MDLCIFSAVRGRLFSRVLKSMILDAASWAAPLSPCRSFFAPGLPIWLIFIAEDICQLSTLGRLPHFVLKSEYPLAFRDGLLQYQSALLPELDLKRSGAAALLLLKLLNELLEEELSASSLRPCCRRRARTSFFI